MSEIRDENVTITIPEEMEETFYKLYHQYKQLKEKGIITPTLQEMSDAAEVEYDEAFYILTTIFAINTPNPYLAPLYYEE